ncbi:MAG: hypothetical protein IPK79_04715 [Vampirovibrionales bacterium]|nr:hypothetical protein [Vampirovibrionales bacterium]
MPTPVSKLLTAKTLQHDVAYAFLGLAPRLVGPMFRINDDKYAPSKVKQDTLRREGSQAGLAFAAMLGIQLIYSAVSKQPPIRGLSQKAVAFLTKPSHEAILRMMMTLPAFAGSEYISRLIAPRAVWGPNGRLDAQPPATPPSEKPPVSAPVFSTVHLLAPMTSPPMMSPMRAPAFGVGAMAQPRFTNAGGLYAQA